MMRDRALVVIAASLVVFALQANGQEPVHRVGVLASLPNPGIRVWEEGLRERGYVVGQNLQPDICTQSCSD